MADYIESEIVIKIVTKIMCDTKVRHKGRAINRNIKQLSTADVQEVRHGKWIEKPYLLGTSNFCSLCGENYGMPHGKHNFCPNCGAKMDRGEQE